MSEVPNLDKEPENQSQISDYEEKLNNITIEKEKLELKLLDLQVKNEEISSREADQRYNLKGWAVVVITMILIGMFFLINTIVGKLLLIKNWEEIPTTIIGIYAIPIISVTALAISLLIAAFRGYKSNDASDTADVVSKTARASTTLG